MSETSPTGTPASSASVSRYQRMIAFLGLDEGWQRIVLMGLLVVILTLIIIPKGQFFLPDYDPGDVARRDVKSPRDLLIADDELTDKKRTAAEVSVPVLYDFYPQAGKAIATRVAEIFDYVHNEARRNLSDEAQQDELEKAFGLHLPVEQVDTLRSLAKEEETKQWLVELIGRLYSRKVVGNLRMYERDREQGIALRNVTTLKERVAEAGEAVLGASDLQNLLREEFRNRRLNAIQGKTLGDLLTAVLRPSISYNQSETESRRQAARDAVQPVLIQVKSGEILVREGDRISAEQISKLDALRAQGSRAVLGSHLLGLLLGCFILLFITHRFGSRNIRKYRLSNRDLRLIATVLIGMTLILKLGNFVAIAVGSAFPYIDSWAYHYAFPVAAGAMLVRIVLNSEVALIFSLVLAVICGFLFGNSFELSFFALLSSLAGAHWVRQLTFRTSMYWAGLRLALFNIATILAIHLVTGQEFGLGLLFELGMGVCGALLTALLVSGLIPLIEAGFQYTTNLKLVELANMNNPLLRELMIQAPGTYHHSIIVGNLAESAAETIGANPLLVRVAAYYHDIGKAKKPLYFIENVGGGENKHDKLAPSMSALILTGHIKDGLEMAREQRLGKELIDILQQHHGTSLMKFFHERAKQREEREVDEHDYRYPGPKPQTREAALIMLADAVEAASRTLTDPTPARIQGMVQKIINNIFSDGQLDECELTLKDLHNIAKSFNRVLGGIFHHRIDYPEPVSKERSEKGPKKTDEDRDREPAEPGESSKAPAKKRRTENLKRLGMS